ncbi:MAG: DNA-binding protein [Gemmataceae bacterium]
MSTLTFELPTEQAEALTREAERRNVRVEDLLRELAGDFLTRTQAFDAAARYVLDKNVELYRRLAK